MGINSKTISIAFMTASVLVTVCRPCQADEIQTSVINWQRLQLSPSQSQAIQSLEGQWTQEYMQVQPSIIDEQRKLTRLLADPKSDPLEIMSCQQALARKREQLRATATASYLRKRQILNESQQHSLEDMMRQAVAERQRVNGSGSQADAMPDRIQVLMRKIQTAFPGR